MYIIIVGGGNIGGEMAKMLSEKRHDVVVIEKEKEVCERLYADLGVVVINGNAARAEVLKEAGVEKADVLVAASAHDADNLACSILARSFGVDQIIVRMRYTDYANAYKLAGVNSVIRVSDLMINQMIMEIEKPEVRKLISIGGGKAHIYSVTVPPGALVSGETVENIVRSDKFPPNCVFIAIYNRLDNEFSIPRGQHVINEGDELFLTSTSEDISKVAEFLTE